MLHLKKLDLKKTKTTLLAIPVCEDKPIHDDEDIVSLIEQAKTYKEFTGKKGDELILYNLPDSAAERVVFLGLGPFKKLDAEALRSLSGTLVKKCLTKDFPDITIAAPVSSNTGIEPSELIEAILEGACLANHFFDKYIEKKERKQIAKINVVVPPPMVRKFRLLPGRVETICSGTLLAREWVNTPSNDKRPEAFAKTIQTLARKEKLKVHVLDEKALQQKKFGAMLAVAAGSQSKPRLVIMDYHPKGAGQTLVLVGKGVTFDSGGINLKTGPGLVEMKCDMAGAAAVAATLLTVSRLKAKMRIIGVLPLVENMPSGNATRPGDIVKTFLGKTVEIKNTDAEGRLILIDAMAYAVKTFKPDMMIDLATLTGACMVALGDHIAGVFSSDEKLVQAILASGKKTHERCWQLPLPEDYRELLKSDFADISNLPNSRMGGAITAALFLSEFVQDVRWAHIDIAGAAYHDKAMAYCRPGATGFGVRLLCDLLDRL